MSIDVLNNKFASLNEDKQRMLLEYASLLAIQQHQEEAENRFWSLISTMNYAGKSNEEVIAPLVDVLAGSHYKFIYEFEDTLAEKLSALDGPAYFEVAPGSADSYLYARCCVVMNGKDYYLKVLNNPENFPADYEFEALLYVTSKAFFKRTGKEWTYTPKTNYESFYNKENWGEEAIHL